MSITDAFRLLNNSIRGVREQEMAHEQRMMQGKLQEQQLQMQLSDPSRRLKDQQARAQLAPTEAQSFDFSPEGKNAYQIDIWENTTLKDLNDIAPEGAEYNKKGKLVMKGTDSPYVAPKWQIDELNMQAETVMAMGNYKDKALENEKASIEYDIGNLETLNRAAKGVGHKGSALSDAHKLKLGSMKQRLNQVNHALTDPDVNMNNLLTTHQNLSNVLDSLYRSKSPNQKMIANVINRMETNAKVMSQLGKKSNVKTKQVPYHYKDQKTGEVITIKETYGEGHPIRDQIRRGMDGAIFTRGEYKAPSGSGAGAMSEASKDAAIKNYTDLQNVIAGTANDITKKRVLDTFLAQGKSDEERQRIKGLLDTADEEIINNLKDRASNLRRRHGHKTWWVGHDTEKRVYEEDKDIVLSNSQNLKRAPK